MIIKAPFSIFMQISSSFFFMAGNFSDLLIIRICLSSAYAFLFINSVLGGPLWPSLRVPGHLQLDGMFWAALNLYVHVSTVVRLLLDERPVQLNNEELWRMFYRTGGLSKKLFQRSIDPYCHVVTYHKNDTIPLDDEYGNRKWFYIIYKGRVRLKVVGMEEPMDDELQLKGEGRKSKIMSSTTRVAQSGQLFDFRCLGFLKDAAIAQNQQHKHKLSSAEAVSDTVVLFRFPAQLMATNIASDPTTRLMWKELLMENLLRIVQRHFYKTRREKIESKHASESMHDGNNGHGTFFDCDGINPAFWTLEKWEVPDPLLAGSGEAWRTPFRHIAKSMEWSFTPPWPFKGFPMGFRHKQYLSTPSPPSDVDSNNGVKVDDDAGRTSAEGDAENQSLLPSEPSAGYSSVESFRQEDGFLEYLDEMDEATGLGLNISFLANSSTHGSTHGSTQD